MDKIKIKVINESCRSIKIDSSSLLTELKLSLNESSSSLINTDSMARRVYRARIYNFYFILIIYNISLKNLIQTRV